MGGIEGDTGGITGIGGGEKTVEIEEGEETGEKETEIERIAEIVEGIGAEIRIKKTVKRKKRKN